MIKGIIFDFNGTLFFDGPIHKAIWKQIYINVYGSDKWFDLFFKEYMAGQNTDIFKSLYELSGKNITNIDYLKQCSEEKEKVYRDIVRTHKFELVNGATQVLDYIKKYNIPTILCTNSIKSNVDFFFDYFKLGNWFNRDEAIIDDDDHNEKSEMYKEAIEKLNEDPYDILIIEDSHTGVNAAIKAGAKKIVVINKNKDEFNEEEVIAVIDDFRQFPISLIH